MSNGGTWCGKPKVEERRKFFELVNSGVSIKAACRTVGIHRSTGKEWLYGRPARPGTTKEGRKRYRPAVQPMKGALRVTVPNPRHEERLERIERTISSRYLSEEERVRIADLRREKNSIRAIAAGLGRSPATVSRELRRNCNANFRPSHPS